jgi:hypothetical protein
MSNRERAHSVILSTEDEARVSAYRSELESRGWGEKAAENEARLLRYSLQSRALDAIIAAEEAEQARMEREKLREIQVAPGFGLDESFIAIFGIAPVVEDANPKIRVSARLLAEVNESREAIAMSSRDLWQNIQLGKKNPTAHFVWGIVHHPEHGLITVTAEEFDALELPEYVPK